MLLNDCIVIFLVGPPVDPEVIDNVSDGVVANLGVTAQLLHGLAMDLMLVNDVKSLSVRYFAVDIVFVVFLPGLHFNFLF